jgi:hypothetical protein
VRQHMHQHVHQHAYTAVLTCSCFIGGTASVHCPLWLHSNGNPNSAITRENCGPRYIINKAVYVLHLSLCLSLSLYLSLSFSICVHACLFVVCMCSVDSERSGGLWSSPSAVAKRTKFFLSQSRSFRKEDTNRTWKRRKEYYKPSTRSTCTDPDHADFRKDVLSVVALTLHADDFANRPGGHMTGMSRCVDLRYSRYKNVGPTKKETPGETAARTNKRKRTPSQRQVDASSSSE